MDYFYNKEKPARTVERRLGLDYYDNRKYKVKIVEQKPEKQFI